VSRKGRKERFFDLEARIDWLEMYCTLPIAGFQQAFPDTASCQQRLADVRWPSGVTCPSCGDRNIGMVESRALYQCRSCRTQFSLTAGTIMHRSRLDLMIWFIAAVDVITAYAHMREEEALIGHGLAKRYRISYAAIHRLKTALVKDLRQPGNLLRACICTEALPVTRDPLQTPDEWYETLWYARP